MVRNFAVEYQESFDKLIAIRIANEKKALEAAKRAEKADPSSAVRLIRFCFAEANNGVVLGGVQLSRDQQLAVGVIAQLLGTSHIYHREQVPFVFKLSSLNTWTARFSARWKWRDCCCGARSRGCARRRHSRKTPPTATAAGADRSGGRLSTPSLAAILCALWLEIYVIADCVRLRADSNRRAHAHDGAQGGAQSPRARQARLECEQSADGSPAADIAARQRQTRAWHRAAGQRLRALVQLITSHPKLCNSLLQIRSRTSLLLSLC